VVLEPYQPILWEYGTKSPAELHKGLSCSKIWPSYKSILIASWMHLRHFRCVYEHLRMFFQMLRTLYLAAGGPASIWKYLTALVRSTRVSGRCACCFRTDLHFADAHLFHTTDKPHHSVFLEILSTFLEASRRSGREKHYTLQSEGSPTNQPDSVVV